MWISADRIVKVLAFDPGGTTGWGLIWVRLSALFGRGDILDGLEWDCGEFTGSEDHQANECLALMAEHPDAVYVFEGFKLLRLDVELSPVRITAKVEFGLWIDPATRGREIFFQSPSDAKNTVTDIRQKRWGLWEPGKEHARDGIKHAVLFARRCANDRSLRESAFGNLKVGV